jgi:site-specific recombinase XerC
MRARTQKPQAMGEGNDDAPAPTWHWVDDLARPWRFLAALRERRRARRACIEALQLYRAVQAERPDLARTDCYAAVVARRTGADANSVDSIIRRAEDSFASWPVARPLSFRDVVQYLVVSECLKENPAAIGVRAPLMTVIAKVIPKDL